MTWRVGDWTVHPSLTEIENGPRRVKIDPRAMAVLVHLVERAGAVVSTEELLDSVWADVVVTQSSVYKAITQLRRALDDDSREPRYIRNVPRVGYRLVAPVTALVEVQDAPVPVAASAAPPVPAHAVPEWPQGMPVSFDGVTLLRLLGSGASGEVYLARETTLERLVAVKVLRPEVAADPVAQARFRREAQALARIRDPHVAAVHRVAARTDGAQCLIMEYIDGRSLADPLLREGVRDADSCRRIAVGLARALAAADTQGIVHRDVKPANVMVERATGRVVLTDFGIARFAESARASAPPLTRLGDKLGDPRYVSPERIRGEAPTPASDIYALGVVLYELLTGAGPHGAAEPHEVVESHLSGSLVDLSRLRPDVPIGVVRCLERCVAASPVRRPTAAELVAQLAGDAASSAPVVAADAPPRSTVRRTLALGSAALLVAAAAAWAWFVA